MKPTSKPWKKIAATFLAATALAGCGRVTENEVMVVMNKGSFQDVVTKPELYCVPMCSIFTSKIYFKTFPDTFTISSGSGANAGGGDDGGAGVKRKVFLRSKDDKFIESISLSVTYEVAKTDSVWKLVTEFRADHLEAESNALAIRDDLQILTTQPLVNTVRQYDALDIQDKGQEIGAKLVEELQMAVDARLELSKNESSPLRIKAVTLGGVEFDPETEELLRKKIYAREQSGIAAEATLAAKSQAEASRAQAAITANIVQAMVAAGAKDGEVANLVCLDLQRQKLIPTNLQCFGIGANQSPKP